MKISAVIRHFLKIFSTEVQKKISSNSSEVQNIISAVVRRTSADFIPTLRWEGGKPLQKVQPHVVFKGK